MVYDNKQAFSHHATDPAGNGHLQNAYDLVRLHKFGDDKESIKKMNELASNDPRVRREMDKSLFEDFGDIDPSDDESDESETMTEEDIVQANLRWSANLERDAKTQAILPTVRNLEMILANDTRIKDGIGGYNEFSCRHEKFGSLPWKKFDPRNPGWTDADDAGLRSFIENSYGIWHRAKLEDALSVVTQRRRFHPIRDYLDSLEWDGETRIETLLVDYMGADDNAYVRAITRKHLVAAVARIYQPGIKYDYVLDLVGDQGIGKSQLIERLATKPEYFTDSIQFDRKKLVESTQGKWLCEIGEMAAAKKADEADLKAAISATQDTVRMAYARNPQTFLRQFVLWGSTNEGIHLKDQTGNRRFWPVDCHPEKRKHSPYELKKEEVDQIWAEAKSCWEKGENLHLSEDLEQMAKEAQEAHTFVSEEEGLITDFLERKIPKGYYGMDESHRRDWYLNNDTNDTEERGFVCGTEVWVVCLGRRKEDFNRAEQIRIGTTIAKAGWKRGERSRQDALYGRQRYFWRQPNDQV